MLIERGAGDEAPAIRQEYSVAEVVKGESMLITTATSTDEAERGATVALLPGGQFRAAWRPSAIGDGYHRCVRYRKPVGGDI